jgi:D-serine deaminase-like pyridoxal phosphate-dependent protein
MTIAPPARIGQSLQEADTPSLVLDMEALEANIGRMQGLADAAGVALRPHAKSHKSANIGRMQMEAGGAGVCCQKVTEAELLVQNGVGDILVSNQVVGATKIGKLARLGREARVGVCIDDAGNLAEIAAAARQAGAMIDVLVEVDVGMGRCGVGSDVAVHLSQQILATEGIGFGGLQAYNGRAQHIRTREGRRKAIEGSAGIVRETLAGLKAAGIECPQVTGAGTGTFEFEAASGIWTELQCGSYVFMDADYGRNEDETGTTTGGFQNSLFILGGVLSVAQAGRAVIDAGLKSMSMESGLPELIGLPEAAYAGASDEHGTLTTGQGNGPALGDRVRLIPGHCDPTVNLHDWFVCVRGDTVVDVWPVTARGAVF